MHTDRTKGTASPSIHQIAAQMRDLQAWRRTTREELGARASTLRRLPTAKDYTYLGRYAPVYREVLLPLLHESVGQGELRVLEVGTGKPPLEPLELFAHLSQGGFQPEVTVVDIDAANIGSFSRMTEISMNGLRIPRNAFDEARKSFGVLAKAFGVRPTPGGH